MNKSPCLDCKYRSLYCHSSCESYLEYRKLIDLENKRRRGEIDINGYMVENIRKFKKRRNLPQYR